MEYKALVALTYKYSFIQTCMERAAMLEQYLASGVQQGEMSQLKIIHSVWWFIETDVILLLQRQSY